MQELRSTQPPLRPPDTQNPQKEVRQHQPFTPAPNRPKGGPNSFGGWDQKEVRHAIGDRTVYQPHLHLYTSRENENLHIESGNFSLKITHEKYTIHTPYFSC
ncbi:hypothetical protein AVEN_236009-1 [Araneus ventricosus]|uniref:Uncharacterized protein n=1 Tax=Araneus ventricosus TaxID=182803 RepID=A0A4Y2Q0J3_ARAVE|nr:hypothetical protein AVEN_926-1 [Araneus ventricosus]GBN57009.1 hypothetical protein AVEN_236009-1 [Araneus ventricosus]